MSKEKIPAAILSSAKLNEKSIFLQYKEQIRNTLLTLEPNKYIISIGKLKNKLMIDFVHELGYEVQVIAQHPKSLKNSNRKIIKENALILFFIYEESSVMMELLAFSWTVLNGAVVPIHLHGLDTISEKL